MNRRQKRRRHLAGLRVVALDEGWVPALGQVHVQDVEDFAMEALDAGEGTQVCAAPSKGCMAGSPGTRHEKRFRRRAHQVSLVAG